MPEGEVLMEEFLFANQLIKDDENTFYYINWMQKGIMKIKHIWDRGKATFKTMTNLVDQHNLTPNVRTENEYKRLLRAIPPTLTSNLHRIRSNTNVINWEEAFSLTELYEVTVKGISPKAVYQRLMLTKLKGFEACYTILERAGLTQGDRDEDRKKINQWWTHLNRSDLDHKTWQFQWKMSHNGLHTGIVLHRINPDIEETCTLCRDDEETIEHIFLRCKIVIDFWEWIFDKFNFTTTLNKTFIYFNNFEEMNKLQFFITILGKATIWEMLGILRKTPIRNTLMSLKLNFKFKLQAQLNNLNLRYKFRMDNSFDDNYLLHNIIERNGVNVEVRLDI